MQGNVNYTVLQRRFSNQKLHDIEVVDLIIDPEIDTNQFDYSISHALKDKIIAQHKLINELTKPIPS